MKGSRIGLIVVSVVVLAVIIESALEFNVIDEIRQAFLKDLQEYYIRLAGLIKKYGEAAKSLDDESPEKREVLNVRDILRPLMGMFDDIIRLYTDECRIMGRVAYLQRIQLAYKQAKIEVARVAEKGYEPKSGIDFAQDVQELTKLIQSRLDLIESRLEAELAPVQPIIGVEVATEQPIKNDGSCFPWLRAKIFSKKANDGKRRVP